MSGGVRLGDVRLGGVGSGVTGSVGRRGVGRHGVKSHGVVRTVWSRAGGMGSVGRTGGVAAHRVRSRGIGQLSTRGRLVGWTVGSR
jgi:hypothetical protein